MKKQLPIYIERLVDGQTEEINEVIDPKLLAISDKEITANNAVTVTGEAYIADPFLLLQLSISTTLDLACSVCNEPFSYPVEITRLMNEVAFEEVPGGVFDL